MVILNKMGKNFENYSYLMHHCKVSGQIIHTFMRRPFLIFHIVANQNLPINIVFLYSYCRSNGKKI
jgi:hypothetical protein